MIQDGNLGPSMSLDQAKAVVADKRYPKVTEESIKDKIARATFYSHKAMTGGVLTICVIEMSNGFMTQGVSAAADPRNHDPEVGKRYAFENAFKPLWQLEGYLLRQRLFEKEQEADSRGVMTQEEDDHY